MEEGYVFGIWNTGPWLGFKGPQNSVYEWLALGENFLKDFQIWRHSCISIDSELGEVKLFENGALRFEGKSEVLVKLTSITHVAAGCFYYFKSSGVPGYMSMFGKVTDLQIFSEILSEDEMKKITSCENRKEGDILSWNQAKWMLSGNGNIEKEMLNLQEDVCKVRISSLYLLPRPSTFHRESIFLCMKLSGTPVDYSSKEELNEIARYIDQTETLALEKCKYDGQVSIWIGNSDEAVEGVWRRQSTKALVNFLPWDEGRPYAGGNEYNCMRLKKKDEQDGDKIVVTDEECKAEYFCPVCRIPHPTLKVSVR